MPERILVVEDDRVIAQVVRSYLEEQGFVVFHASSGPEALTIFQAKEPALIVLDLGLPELDGVEVLKKIRESSSVPVIVLTARAEEADRVLGLELGADDYVTKPFSARELAARVKAVLRRASGEITASETISSGGLTIDLKRRVVKLKDRKIELTPTEFDLLAHLARHPGQVFTRMNLLNAIKGYAYDATDRTIDVHIRNLRKKLEPDPQNPQYILTVRGVGYKFREEQ